MWDLLELVLDELRIDNDLTKETRDKIKMLRGHPQKAKVFLGKIKAEMSLDSCIKCDNRSFCSLFLACIYYELNEEQKVHTYAKRAVRDFELGNFQWNATLANWVYGEMYILLGREMPACRVLSEMIKAFDEMGKEFRWEDRYEDRDKCVVLSSKIKKRLENLDKNWDGTAYYEKKRDSPLSPDTSHPYKPVHPMNPNRYPWKRSQLIFPVQSQIHAGTIGNFIFDNHPDLEAVLDELIFNEETHCFYNMREEGNPIILIPRGYRWFRIDGNSMNQAEPIPIMDKDYILAIDLNMSSIDVQFGSIVIAELYNPSSNERAGVLKKYTSNGLESRSSNEYPIIPRGKANIRGVAIAVAKPIKKT